MAKIFHRIMAIVFIVCFCFLQIPSFIITPVSAEGIVTFKLSNELETAVQLNNSEKIPVCIWATDINQQAIEKAIKKDIGYNKNDLISKASTVSLINSQQSTTFEQYMEHGYSFEETVQMYIEATKEIRKAAQQRVNEYIELQRSSYKEAYTEQNEALIDRLDLEQADILYISQYSPMIIAKMSPSKITVAQTNSNIVSMDICDNQEVTAIETISSSEALAAEEESDLIRMKTQYGIDTIHNSFGLTGDSVIVGVSEGGCMGTHEELPSDRCFVVGSSSVSDHATGSARVVAGENGIAYEATLYSSGHQAGDYPYNMYAGIELLLDQNVTVINYSYAYSSIGQYSNMEHWMDHIASVHGVTFVASANNYGLVVARPASAYNVIAIGGYDGNQTATIEDDVFNPNVSCYVDDNGVAKPDLIGPTDFEGGGTSRSAPFVAGIVALIMELQPTLSLQPHAVKAILMAACQNKVTSTPQETMSSTGTSHTDMQGAGAINPIMAIAITSAGNYGLGEMNIDDTSDSVIIQQPSYGATGMTVALTWLHETTANENDLTQELPSTIYEMSNMSLTVSQNNQNIVTSDLSNSSTEFAYLVPSTTDDIYTFNIQKNTPTVTSDANLTSTRYAYAWAITTQQFQYQNTNKGMYYIKNKNNDQYLSVNPSQTVLGLSQFVASYDYQWILKPNADTYSIACGSGTGKSISIGDEFTTDAYKSSTSSSNPAVLSVVPNNDGSYSFTTEIVDATFALTANSYGIQWTIYDSTNLAQRWLFESCNFQNGDINTDGVIDSTDKDIYWSYNGGSILLTDRQAAFADINGDGLVNSVDAYRLLLFINGQSDIL